MKKVIVPAANFNDIVLDQLHVDKIEIIPVSTISDVWENALTETPEKNNFLSSVRNFLNVKKIVSGKGGVAGSNVA